MHKKHLILLLLLLFIPTGCAQNTPPQTVDPQPETSSKEPRKKAIPADTMCEYTLEYLKNKDTQNLKDLFCDEIKNTHDIDKEISEFFDFVNGDFIEFTDYKYELADGGEYDKGIYVNYFISDQIQVARTDTDNVYQLEFYANIIHRKEPSKVGLEYIKCTNEDGEIKYIGEFID